VGDKPEPLDNAEKNTRERGVIRCEPEALNKEGKKKKAWRKNGAYVNNDERLAGDATKTRTQNYRMSWKSESSKTTACAPAWGKVVAAGVRQALSRRRSRAINRWVFPQCVFSSADFSPPSLLNALVQRRDPTQAYRLPPLSFARLRYCVYAAPPCCAICIALVASAASEELPLSRRTASWARPPASLALSFITELGHWPSPLTLLLSRSPATGPPRSRSLCQSFLLLWRSFSLYSLACVSFFLAVVFLTPPFSSALLWHRCQGAVSGHYDLSTPFFLGEPNACSGPRRGPQNSCADHRLERNSRCVATRHLKGNPSTRAGNSAKHDN